MPFSPDNHRHFLELFFEQLTILQEDLARAEETGILLPQYEFWLARLQGELESYYQTVEPELIRTIDLSTPLTADELNARLEWWVQLPSLSTKFDFFTKSPVYTPSILSLIDKLNFTLAQLRIKLFYEEKSHFMKLIHSIRYLNRIYLSIIPTTFKNNTQLILDIHYTQAYQTIEQEISDVFRNLKPLYREFLFLTGTNFNVFQIEFSAPLQLLKAGSRLLLKTPPEQENIPLIQKFYPVAQQTLQFVEIIVFIRKIAKYLLRIGLTEPSQTNFFEQQEFQNLCTLHNLFLDVSLKHLPSFPESEALRFVFNQLLSNAVQFTPAGGTITISGRATEQAVEMVVSDTGIGLDEEHLEAIFEQFYQVNPTNSPFWQEVNGEKRLLGLGLGVGLAVCRHIVEAHHGRIWAESAGYHAETYHGSQFHVLLPLVATPAG